MKEQDFYVPKNKNRRTMRSFLEYSKPENIVPTTLVWEKEVNMTTIIVNLINISAPIVGLITIPSTQGELKTWEVSPIKEVILESGVTTLGVILTTATGEKVELPLGEPILIHGNQLMATQVELPLGEPILIHGNQLMATQEEGPEGLEMIELKIITGVEEA